MKNSPLISILVGALTLSAVVSLVLAYFFFTRDHDLKTLSGQVQAIQRRQVAVNALAQDALQYSTHNHAIDPILEANNIRRNPADASQAPSGKPAGK
jgi:hypothetical protein